MREKSGDAGLPHASRITHHASRITFHVPTLTTARENSRCFASAGVLSQDGGSGAPAAPGADAGESAGVEQGVDPPRAGTRQVGDGVPGVGPRPGRVGQQVGVDRRRGAGFDPVEGRRDAVCGADCARGLAGGPSRLRMVPRTWAGLDGAAAVRQRQRRLDPGRAGAGHLCRSMRSSPASIRTGPERFRGRSGGRRRRGRRPGGGLAASSPTADHQPGGHGGPAPSPPSAGGRGRVGRFGRGRQVELAALRRARLPAGKSRPPSRLPPDRPP